MDNLLSSIGPLPGKADNALMSSMGPTPGKAEGTLLTGLWARCRSFLLHITLVVLVALFMRFYVDGHTFFLGHTLSLQQANGTITYQRVAAPVQRDITTIISILASTARGAATFWLAGIDMRCIFLFMKRGGVTFEGLQSMFGRSLPGRRHFQWKTNFFILGALHAGIFASTYTSSILAGSVTWKASTLFKPGQPVNSIPVVRTGDQVYFTDSSTSLDSFIGYSTAIYSIFYGDTKYRFSTLMHRLIPDTVISLPNGSIFDEVLVPYFAIDAFEWIDNPNSTLSPPQLNLTIQPNISGPRIMTMHKFGLIPNERWGPSDLTFPEPLTISESRILVISGRQNSSLNCDSNSFGPFTSTIPSSVQPFPTILNRAASCLIFANVTYRAGAARSRRSHVLGPGTLEDIGDVGDLQLVPDPVTSVALSFAPYVSTMLYNVGYALPYGGKVTTMETLSRELLSRSYQVTWNALVSLAPSNESRNVTIAIDASTASVLMWRVALWGALHAILITFGFAFRHLHSGRYPWIEDPVTAALLVDPTTLMKDPRTWSGKDAPHIAGTLKLEERGASTYLVLEERKDEKKTEVDLEAQK